MDRNTPPGNPWRDLENFVDVRTGLLWARVVVARGAAHSAARTGRPHARCRQTPHRQQSRIPGTRPGHSLPRASPAFPPSEGRSPPSPHLSTPDAFIFCFIVCMLRCVPLFATPGTVTHQAPLSMEILQARILEWVAISFSSGSFQLRDQTHVFCIGRRALYL